MFKHKSKYKLNWQSKLSGYITDLVWSPFGDYLAASSASGEVQVWRSPIDSQTEAQVLLELSDKAIDCLAFCHDGKYLAATGQNGQVKIWRSTGSEDFTLYQTIDYQVEHPSIWIDRLAWHPRSYLLAFNLGREVQVWDIAQNKMVAALDFEESTVSDLGWNFDGSLLAVGGKNRVKAWDAKDWLKAPLIFELASASEAIAWSKDGKYLASANQDWTVMLAEIESDQVPDPWLLSGFPGKIRHLAWSDCYVKKHGTPLFAVASANGVAVWIKEKGQKHWQCWILDLHKKMVRSVAFQPNSLLLATVADDGLLCLWYEAVEIVQIIKQESPLCCLAWHPQADRLACGSESGEIVIYAV